MLDDLETTLRVYAGLIGGLIASSIGSLTRNVYDERGFSWRRVIFDMPFVCFCAILAGGVGEWLQLPSLVSYALAGSGSFIGHEVLREAMQSFYRRKSGGGDETKQDG